MGTLSFQFCICVTHSRLVLYVHAVRCIYKKLQAVNIYFLSSCCSITTFMICFPTSRYFHLHFLHIYFISISIIIKLLFHLNKSQGYAAKNWNTNNNLISFEYTTISSYIHHLPTFTVFYSHSCEHGAFFPE